MNRSAVRHRVPTVEDYLELEKSSSVRHEYVAGEIFALAGASKRHNRILGNIYAHLWSTARGGPCRVYVESVKLQAAEDVIYYPDVMVACGPESDHPWIEDAPCLVAEVISPSTESTDRRERLAAYKRLSTLRAYLIVHQEQRRVERHWRDAEGEWWQADLVGCGTVSLPCPEARLTLDQIYEGVDTPA